MPELHLATLGEDPGLRGLNLSTNCTNVRSLCKLGGHNACKRGRGGGLFLLSSR
jgi:hypothetical protein